MNVHYESCEQAPDAGPMNALLGDYYALMTSRIEEMGGAAPTGGQQATKEFWNEIDLFLPPHGRLFLARDDDGALLGCGSLKKIDARRGELKRLFVRPSARGLGVGRKLVQLRIDAARDMGLNELLVDTLKNNVEMQGLYDKLGFSRIDIYRESATLRMVPELGPYLCFFSMKL